jgi:phosphopantetheinyl transferase
MSLLYKGHRDALSFGIWHITETEAELERFSGCSAPARISNPSRRCEYLSIRALAVDMGLDPGKIEYQTSGKPFLTDYPGTISFSHTKNYAAIVVAPHVNVGIDIEQRTERVVRIRHKFMHPLEEAALKEAALIESNWDTNTGLLLHWCAKEAVFKAVPEEAIDFAQEIRVSRLPLLQSLNDLTETGTSIPNSQHHQTTEGLPSKRNTLTKSTKETIGEVRFLRNNSSFQLEGWSTAAFVLVICYESLTDLHVSE